MLGIVVFGDVVHVTPLLLAVQLCGVAAIVGGVILVARAPVFGQLHLGQLPHAALERLPHPGDLLGHVHSHDGEDPSPERGDSGESGKPELVLRGDGHDENPGRLASGNTGDMLSVPAIGPTGEREEE